MAFDAIIGAENGQFPDQGEILKEFREHEDLLEPILSTLQQIAMQTMK